MRLIFIILGLITFGSAAKADSIGNGTIDAEFAETTGQRHFACTIEAERIDGTKVVIVANPFAVPKRLKVSRHDVITQVYFTARQVHRKVYDEALGRGGFYATCHEYPSFAAAGKAALRAFERAARKKNLDLKTLDGYAFSYETHLMAERARLRYR